MKHKNIKVGQTLLITGHNNGCNLGKCYDCPFYSEHRITVKNIWEEPKSRCINGVNFYDNSHSCTFDPRDLSPLNWRDRFK